MTTMHGGTLPDKTEYCPNAGDENPDRDQSAPFFDHLVDEVQSGATWPKMVGEKTCYQDSQM